jgi:hypothetical protein
VLVVGCDTQVAEPDATQPSGLDNPLGAEARRAGAIGQFANGFSQQAEISGLLADEFTEAGSVTDQRLIPDYSGLAPSSQDKYPYDVLSLARIDALRAIATLKSYEPTTRSEIGGLYAYLGYIEVFFGENMCSGIPEGVVSGDNVAYGPTVTRSGLLREAITDFDSAQTYASDSTGIANLASVGLARALVDSGALSAAAAQVSTVPSNFVYQPPYDGVYQVNAIVSASNIGLILSVSDREGGNGVDFISGSDPRVPIIKAGNDQSGNPVYSDGAYSALSSPLTLASGVEARLIEAEAHLAQGDIAGWAAILNALRANQIQPPMNALPVDSTTNASATIRQAVQFRERALWLFATGHRQGDLRRLIRYYGWSEPATFPNGDYRGTASQYGSATTFVPYSEQGNPTYHGCIDRNP